MTGPLVLVIGSSGFIDLYVDVYQDTSETWVVPVVERRGSGTLAPEPATGRPRPYSAR
jgi:hypothetical protein